MQVRVNRGKMSLMKIILIFLCGKVALSWAFENLLCSDEFCKEYKEKHKCKNLGSTCKIQNETFNGEIYDDAVPCGCCQFCMQHLNEGEFCSIGEAGMAPPTAYCGPGLTCVQVDSESRDYQCKKMENMPCLRDQAKYDELKNKNKTGRFMKRPYCDGSGNYKNIKCNIGQMCFCVDEKGERIFGEALYHPLIEKTMNCECARLNVNVRKMLSGKNFLATARCLEDGSYDPLQCMDNKCICVEQLTGALKGNEVNVQDSPSYDRLACFKNAIHSKYKYLHDCEEEQWRFVQAAKESESEGFAVLNFPTSSCQIDGWFPAIQENETSSFCVDKYGRKIQNFEILKTSPEYSDMNCKCARTLALIKFRENVKQNDDILPQCCPNGNFKKVQCRGDYCYCSDLNGLQIGMEKESSKIMKLDCYNNGQFC